MTQNKNLVYPPEPHFTVCEGCGWDPQPETFTDGKVTWEDFGHLKEHQTLPESLPRGVQVKVPDDADTVAYDIRPNVVHVPIYKNIEEQFLAKGFYNVPASVIEHLEEEARKLLEGALIPGLLNAEVNAQPEFDEVLDARLLRDMQDMEPMVRKVDSYIRDAEGLGANSDGDLSVDLTPEEWSWVVVYSMYYTGGQNTTARFHDTSWKMPARHPGFRNRKPVLFTHTASEKEEKVRALTATEKLQELLRGTPQ